MRTSVFVSGLASLLFACGGTDPAAGDDDGGGDESLTEKDPAFTIESNELTVMPGEEFTKCFYFTTPNTDKVVVHKWESVMTPGSHHMIMFRSISGNQPADGTIDDCNGDVAIPIYGTQVPHEEILFPDDDGNGQPLAQELFQTKGYFQMHYFNSGEEPVQAKVTVSAYALIPELAEHVSSYTKTDLVATYNNDIAIPPHAMDLNVKATCPAPADAQIWQVSTHSHKQSMTTKISDGNEMVFESSDWEHPGDRRWSAPDFHTFKSGQMTWECTYTNLGDNQDRTVRAGSSAKTDEMCMMTGYYFPASGPRGCFMNNGSCTCL